MVDVDFWFDPSCPWTWVTSRWIVRAAEVRDIDVRWRPFSLRVRNGEGHEDGHQLLRVMEAVRASAGTDGVGRLYAELGQRRFAEQRREIDVEEALSAAGLDEGLAAAVGERRFDEHIEASTQQAIELAGEDAGSPVLGVPGEPPRAFFGPILTTAPPPEEAGRLWDAVLLMGSCDCFYEMKRARDRRPDLASTR